MNEGTSFNLFRKRDYVTEERRQLPREESNEAALTQGVMQALKKAWVGDREVLSLQEERKLSEFKGRVAQIMTKSRAKEDTYLRLCSAILRMKESSKSIDQVLDEYQSELKVTGEEGLTSDDSSSEGGRIVSRPLEVEEEVVPQLSVLEKCHEELFKLKNRLQEGKENLQLLVRDFKTELERFEKAEGEHKRASLDKLLSLQGKIKAKNRDIDEIFASIDREKKHARSVVEVEEFSQIESPSSLEERQNTREAVRHIQTEYHALSNRLDSHRPGLLWPRAF